MGFQARFIDPGQPTKYEMNIDAFAAEGYNAIITAGSSMGDATAEKAKQYPDIKFARLGIVELPQSPGQEHGHPSCGSIEKSIK